jgi:hypothetical protein
LLIPRLMTRIAAILLGSMTLFAPALARADQATATATSSVDYSFGARVGGYGFRNTAHPEQGDWDDCRMDGLGVFGQRSFTRHLFAEVGFDLYTAQDATGADTPGAMDRISGITTVAAGARIPWRWVSPYLQVGLGLEVTRVEMPEHGLRDSAVVPMGFLGIGLELRATENISLGGNVRTNVMKHYDHGGDAHDPGDTSHTEMTGELDAAAQGQLFLKYQI